MERYTENHYDGNGYYLICSGNCETLDCGDCDILDKIVDRLAAYEETGLEPEEITAIAGLASENCAKTTDKIDQLLSDDKELEEYRSIGPIDLLRGLAQADREGRCVVLPCEVGDTIWMIVTKRPKISMPEFSFIKRSRLSWLNIERVLIDFGKTVFLTYEEAEAALRREPQEDDDCGHGEQNEATYEVSEP